MIAEAKVAPAEPGTSDLHRFIGFIATTGDLGCWIWTGYRSPKGYGQFWFNDRMHWAHRFAYAAFVGPIPDGLTVHHKCQNPACVRPGHLEPATVEDNAAERHEREGQRGGGGIY